MKKFLSLFLLLTAVLFYAQNAQAETSGAGPKREAGFISLSSSVVKEFEPDIAAITFAVENTAENAQKAAAANNEISNKVMKALKTIASDKTDTVKTSNFSVRPVYHNQGGKRVIKNYTAANSVVIETKDIKKVSKFIDAAVSAGANRTDSLNYSLQNEKALCSSMYPSIAKELADTARMLASESGAALDGLKHMNASCSIEGASNGRVFFAKALAVSADGAAEASPYEAPVESGKIKVRAYVNAEYYVK